MAKSRRKGKALELHVCRLLSGWWFPKQYASIENQPAATELPFRSTPLSGGWSSKGDGRGDVVAPADFPFCVECKNQEAWSFEQLLGFGSKPLINDYWVQTVAAAKMTDKIPLLLFTKAYRPIYARVYPVTVDWFASRGIKITPQAVIHGQPYFLFEQLLAVQSPRIKGPVEQAWLAKHRALYDQTIGSTA